MIEKSIWPQVFNGLGLGRKHEKALHKYSQYSSSWSMAPLAGWLAEKGLVGALMAFQE